MAASKKNNNSSKTAHVMNLLSKRRETPPAQEVQETPETKTVPEKETRSTPLPPVMASLSPDAAVSNQIRSALEEALEEELKAQPSPAAPEETEREATSSAAEEVVEEPTPVAAAEETVKESPSPAAEEVVEEPTPSAPVEEPAKESLSPAAEEVMEEPTPGAPVEEPAKESPSPAAKEVVEEPTPVVTAEEPAKETTLSDQREDVESQDGDPTKLICFNVMEELVEEKLEKYIHMFGLCDCPRCLLDVKALALTHLPALYVGIPAFEKNFRLAIYESRYDSAVTAQILQACKTVMEKPRHQLTD